MHTGGISDVMRFPVRLGSSVARVPKPLDATAIVGLCIPQLAKNADVNDVRVK
jgi:hypothetical protein